MAAWRKPFASCESRRTTLVLARELPIEGDPADVTQTVEAYGAWLASSDLPKLLIRAEPGALLTGRALDFCRTWPNQLEATVAGSHYIQEDSPHEIVLGRTSVSRCAGGGFPRSNRRFGVLVFSMP